MALAAAALAVASCQAVIIGSGGSLALIAVLEAVTGVAVSLFFVLWETTLQTHIPQAALSRVSSYDYLLSAGLMPLGLMLAGPVSESPGVRPAHLVRHDDRRGAHRPGAAVRAGRPTPPGACLGHRERHRWRPDGCRGRSALIRRPVNVPAKLSLDIVLRVNGYL
ncbi:hypothetical protein AB0L47_10905 [Streptomyces bobili]|uniref:hypothetical protein n=1 Tax=Streptomyces bobili TaxID=67280 RepID=UPI00342904FE